MAKLETALTASLGLDVPLVQAPIGSATCPALASAVADAGGLGMLALTWRTPTEARNMVQETMERTDRPVGVNIVLDDSATTIPTEDHLAVCAEEGIEIVSFSFGEAAPYVDRVHAFGGTVLQTVGSADEACAAVDRGVDIVVAQGLEAGGHVQSEVATMPLIPLVVDAVPETPVIAAGGIAEGRGVAAALALGAAGAWLGTRFVATKEAHVHERYRERILEADETETVYSTLFDRGWPGVPHRVLRNETVEQWQTAGEPAIDRPDEDVPVGKTPAGEQIDRYADTLAVPGTTGDIDALPLYAGQSSGFVDSHLPAASVVEELATETQTALSHAASLCQD